MSIHNEELRLNGGKKNSENGKKPIKADKEPIKVNNRENIILEYIEANEYITNSQARLIFGLAESTTKRILKEMVEKGLLKIEGEKRGTKYSIM